MTETMQMGWKQAYQLALLETDPRKISSRVDQARAVILDRLSDAAADQVRDERTALNAALRFLRILEKGQAQGIV